MFRLPCSERHLLEMGRHRTLTDFFGAPHANTLRVFAFVEIVAGVGFDDASMYVLHVWYVYVSFDASQRALRAAVSKQTCGCLVSAVGGTRLICLATG